MSYDSERHLELAIKNMYELEGKRTDEIARELHISEAKVIKVLEKYGIIK